MSGNDRMIDALQIAVGALAPRSATAGARLIDAADEMTLFGVEAAAVARARAGRRREFATGRALLRDLLGRQIAIPMAARRAPDFPAGWVGSLAHDDTAAVAVVEPRTPLRALGIDIEPEGPPDAELDTSILRPDDVVADVRLAFAVKEAAYKAWSDPHRPVLAPHDVRVVVSGDRFEATVVADRSVVVGRYALVAGRWLALAVIEN